MRHKGIENRANGGETTAVQPRYAADTTREIQQKCAPNGAQGGERVQAPSETLPPRNAAGNQRR
eukprot:921331-Rhodomonas_salina.1